MIVLGVDPGPKQSAWVVFASRQLMILCSGLEDNAKAADNISAFARNSEGPDHLAVELIRSSYGNPAGPDLFDTAVHSGVFIGHWRAFRDAPSVVLLPRLNVRVHLCGTAKAGDKDIREALRMRLGVKATKGITTHKWAALAVAVTAADLLRCGIPGKEKELCI